MASSVQPSIIALSGGEPASIAPEITALAWSVLRHSKQFAFFVIGDADYMASRSVQAGCPVPVVKIHHPDEAIQEFSQSLPVLHRPLAEKPEAGSISSKTAASVIAAIDEGFELVFRGAAHALVTNPINKDALYHAGFQFQGHTDYLASLAALHGRPSQEVMMLVAKDLRAVPLTVHIPLAQVQAALTGDTITAQATVVARDLQRYFGIANPRIAVTGLNPHAGENGAMGHEEQDIIVPALEVLRAQGLNMIGPLPADTAFHSEARQAYDAILCMYHDQALIPVKTLDFHGGVNVTLGLPIIRTSPDHGTALGIAGSGKANPTSLIAALQLAAEMSRHANG